MTGPIRVAAAVMAMAAGDPVAAQSDPLDELLRELGAGSGDAEGRSPTAALPDALPDGAPDAPRTERLACAGSVQVKGRMVAVAIPNQTFTFTTVVDRAAGRHRVTSAAGAKLFDVGRSYPLVAHADGSLELTTDVTGRTWRVTRITVAAGDRALSADGELTLDRSPRFLKPQIEVQGACAAD
jgi:hypothetical protein